MKAKAPWFSVENSEAELKSSKPVRVLDVGLKTETQSLVVICDDGCTRTCHTKKLRSHALRVSLTELLFAVKDTGSYVQFNSAGGWSPDEWFCEVVLLSDKEAKKKLGLTVLEDEFQFDFII